MRIWLWPAFFLFTACSWNERPISFNLGAETVQLDWNRAVDSTSMIVLENIMEGLTSYSDSVAKAAGTLRPLPALASSWTVIDEGRTIRFNIRTKVYWSDGVPLVAQHFVDSWQRLLAPETRASGAYQLFDIVGAKEFNRGELKDFSQVGIKAEGDSVLVVQLQRPVPYFFHLVAAPATFPLRVDQLNLNGGQWPKPEDLITLGAYRLERWDVGEAIHLSAYEYYYGPKPEIDRIVCRLISEPLTAYALFENGELDVIPGDLPASLLSRLLTRHEFRSGPRDSVSFLVFNTNRPPFNDSTFRRALAEALPREAMAAPFQGAQTPFRSWIPPGMLGYDESAGVMQREERPLSLRGKVIELRYSGSDTWHLVFQTLQEIWKRELGVELRLIPSEPAQLREDLASGSGKRKGDPHLTFLGWVADYPDPHSFMNVFTSNSETNFSGWKNLAYDRLVESAASIDDESLRMELYGRAQKLLLQEDAVILPLFLSGHQALVAQRVRGVVLNPLDKWYFRLWRKSDGEYLRGSNFFRRFRGSGGSS
jgi:oligopeptide transport system substrate-binding protein